LLPGVRPTGPNQVWVADLTYLRLERDYAYLAVILDGWSRRVVGYAVSHLLDARLPLAALEAALESRRPAPGLIHHSDRGVQYASRLYRERLAEAGLRGSMSRTGNPYDNAQVESFMKTVKHEELYLREYATMQDIVERLPRFLEEVYNRRRLHSALGYLPPEEYEALHAETAA
jgi:putative transposase